MTKKYTKNKKTIGLLLTAILAIFLFLFIRNLPSSNEQKVTSDENYREVTSEFMNFSVNVPQNAEVENNLTTFNVKLPTGNIILNRNGTNHSTINEYVNSLQEINGFQLKNKQNILVNENEAVSGYTSDPNNIDNTSKLYIIFVNGTVFTLSTSSPDLYDELDTIAHSFHYTGE